MILGVGYVATASTPVLLGVLRDAGGGFSAPFWALVVAMGVLMLAAAPLSSQRLPGLRASRSATDEATATVASIIRPATLAED